MEARARSADEREVEQGARSRRFGCGDRGAQARLGHLERAVAGDLTAIHHIAVRVERGHHGRAEALAEEKGAIPGVWLHRGDESRALRDLCVAPRLEELERALCGDPCGLKGRIDAYRLAATHRVKAILGRMRALVVRL